jgi:hypothetical protein
LISGNLDNQGNWLLYHCGGVAAVAGMPSLKNEQDPQEVEMRLTLKGHHKCAATVPLARNPSYVLLAGPFGLQSVFFTSLRKTAFLTKPNGLLPHHA